MRHRLQAPKGKKRYALRKQVVEPVLGNIKSMLGFRQCLLRGLDQVRTECSLVTMSWNIYQADVRPGDGETEPNCQCLRASHALSGCPVPIANEIPILRPSEHKRGHQPPSKKRISPSTAKFAPPPPLAGC